MNQSINQSINQDKKNMPTSKVNTSKATTGSSITSLLRSSQPTTSHGVDAAGGAATERGSQPRAATCPPDASAPRQTSHYETDKYQKALIDIDTVQAALETRNDASTIPPALLRDLLHQARAAFRKLLQATDEMPSMRSILEEVKAVHETVRSLPTPPPSPKQSWAQLASASPPPPPPSPPRLSSPCETCEITIRVADPVERLAIAAMPNEAIIHKIQHAHAEAKGVVAARKLPSGDVRIFLISEADKKALLREQNWTQCLGESSTATEQLFQVAVHSVRLDSIDPSKAADIVTLQEQNQALHPGLRISRAKWMKTHHAEGRIHGSLVLGLPEAQMADRLIQRGVVSNFALHMAEYYSPSFRITQCYKCQGYGHIATNCRKSETCGHCSQPHRSQDCNRKDEVRCANCSKHHPAWSGECKARMTAKTRTLHARHSAPGLHQRATESTNGPTASGPDSEWTIVGSRKRKHSPVSGRAEATRTRPAASGADCES